MYGHSFARRGGSLTRITRRQWILAAAATATACSGRRTFQPTEDSITVLYPADETLLGPDFDGTPQFMMFLPLFQWNKRGELEGLLAESWETTLEPNTTTIRLRDGVRWHDGVPVTAHDVKFSLDIRCHPDVQWFPSDSYSVKVIDSLTYSITHHRHNQNGLMSIAGLGDDWTVFYPKHIIEKLDPKGFLTWDFWTHPVGNGPYRYVRHVPKTMMEMEANSEFWRGRPKISRVVLKFADSGAGHLPELLSRQVDAAPYAKRTEVLKMADNPQFAVYENLGRFDYKMSVLYWNQRTRFFSDAAVRKALTLSINRRELLQILGFPPDWPVVDALITKEQMRAREIRAIPNDPSLANRLLDEAGWGKRDRRGIRVRDGAPFEFSVIGSYESDSDSDRREAAVYIQAQLKQVGVQMNIDSLKGGSITQRVRTGDYEAALGGFWWTEGKGQGGFLAAAGYRSSRFLQLENQIHTVGTPGEMGRVYRELTSLFQQDVPATFLYPDLIRTLATRRIRGLDDCPYRGDITHCLGELSLAGAQG